MADNDPGERRFSFVFHGPCERLEGLFLSDGDRRCVRKLWLLAFRILGSDL